MNNIIKSERKDGALVVSSDEELDLDGQAKNKETLDLMDGKIFDKDQEAITLGTSLGGSIIPPDAANASSP